MYLQLSVKRRSLSPISNCELDERIEGIFLRSPNPCQLLSPSCKPKGFSVKEVVKYSEREGWVSRRVKSIKAGPTESEGEWTHVSPFICSTIKRRNYRIIEREVVRSYCLTWMSTRSIKWGPSKMGMLFECQYLQQQKFLPFFQVKITKSPLLKILVVKLPFPIINPKYIQISWNILSHCSC